VPDQIEKILHAEHRLARARLEALRPNDIERLRSAALDREEPYRTRAMEALTTARAPDSHRLLEQVLRAGDEDPGVRAAAAAQLARLGDAEAERALLDALPDATEPTVQVEIAAALAKSGSPRALDALGRLAESAAELVRQQAAFACSVIAYRERQPGFELPVAAPEEIVQPDADQAIPITAGRPPALEVANAIATLAGETYGVRVTGDLSFFIRCGPEQMMLALDQEAATNLGDVAATRPLLLGLLARRAPVDGSYAVQGLLLSWPEKGSRFNVALHRPAGDQLLFGGAERRGELVQFALNTVRQPGAVPATVRGSFERSKFELVDSLSAQTRLEPRAPTAIEPPPD
jgi:hypothetical protein